MKYSLLKELVSLYITEEFGRNRSRNDNTIYSDYGNLDSFSKISTFYEIEENSYSTNRKTVYSVVFKVKNEHKKKFKESGIDIDDIELEVIDDLQKLEHDKNACIENIYNIIQSKNII